MTLASMKTWLVRNLRRAIGTQTILDRLAIVHGRTSGNGAAATGAAAVDLAALVHNMVCNAGDDGVFTATVNDYQLNVPAAMLMMFPHCLHPSLDHLLTYYVETRHLKWMCSQLSPGDVAVDVGASGGLLTAALARSVGPRGQVFAFEPAHRAHRILQRMIVFNELAHVVAEKMAVSSKPGVVQFTEYPFSLDDDLAWRPEVSAICSPRIDAQATTMYEVPATTLDDYFGAKAFGIKMIKIDVEGFEVDVLQGARRILARDRPLLAIDIHRRVDGGAGDTEALVRGILAPHGYRFKKMDHVLVAHT